MRQQTDILHPDNGYIKVFAGTPVANIGLFHNSVLATEKSLLHLSQCTTRLNEVDRLNARGEGLEVAKRLSKDHSTLVRETSSPGSGNKHSPVAYHP